MRFSVIIPVYNVEKYLNECIVSVLGQTLDSFEAILVDDGSVDQSGKICDQFATLDSRVRVIHQDNAGLSAARNTGILNAIGDIVVFLDSDDYWLDNSVLESLDHAFTAASLDFVEFGAVDFYDGSQQPTVKEGCGAPNKGSLYMDEPQAPGMRFSSLIRQGVLTACSWNKAISREKILKEKLFFREGIIAEDIDWNARLLKCSNRVFIIGCSFVAHRRRSSSIAGNSDPFKCKQLISNLKFIEKEVLPEQRYLKTYLALHVANAYIALSRLTLQDNIKLREELRDIDKYLNERVNFRVSLIRFLVSNLGEKFSYYAIRFCDFVRRLCVR